MAKFSEVLTIVNGRNQKQVVCDDGKYPIYGSVGIMGLSLINNSEPTRPDPNS